MSPSQQPWRRQRQRPGQQQEPESEASAPGPTAAAAADDAAPLLAVADARRRHRSPLPTRILLVVAHPDDETMFFTPAIADLQRRGFELFLLCCSTGNFYGEGDVRREEMVAAAAMLGIVGAERVQVLDHPELQDGPANAWPPALLGHLIREAVDRHAIDEIVTFDLGGVSGHPNHGALAQAMAHLQQTTAPGFTPKVWCLETTSFVRKYVGLLDVPLSFLLAAFRSTRRSDQGQDPEMRVALNFQPWQAYSAMLAHASQFVWYRRLFILFSRYTYVNTLVVMSPGPGEEVVGGKGDRRAKKSR